MAEFNKLARIPGHNGIKKSGGGSSEGGAPATVAALEKVEAVALTLENPERYRVQKAVEAARAATAKGDTAAVKRALASVQEVVAELAVAKATRDAIKNAPRFSGRNAVADLFASREQGRR